MLICQLMKNIVNTQKQILILIYANSSSQIGNGHIMRQLALAQTLKQLKYHIVFIYHQITNNIKERLLTSKFDCQNIVQYSIAEYVESRGASILILDDYNLSANEKHKLKLITVPIVTFDDNTDNECIVANLIVNAADDAAPADYVARTDCSAFLLGSDYRLIRSEFLSQRAIISNYSTRNRLVITMGGSDVAKLTLPIVKALLAQQSALPLDIIIGNISNSEEQLLTSLVEQHKNTRLYKNIEDIEVIMASAAMAITAAGGTLYELATLGTPSIGVCVSSNQLSVMNSPLINHGFLAFDYSEKNPQKSLVLILQSAMELWLSVKERQQMSQALFAHFNGLGGNRIAKAIEKLINKNS
jgi:UDP-2,4-diacetamido-2,4,6-trideoxy-beta-L-altropyranose hydrolase